MSNDAIQIVEALCVRGDELGVPLFVVGGAVRDLLRGATFDDRDIDVVVEGNALEFARQVVSQTGGVLKVFPDFYTAKIVAPSVAPSVKEIDFASTRTERYETPGKLPTVKIATIIEDLRRRDFSINAMALPLRYFAAALKGELQASALTKIVLDMHNGVSDLGQKLVRVLHAESFTDDPTRLYRGVRYVTRLNGAFETDTARYFSDALRQNALASISEFRIATEIRKFFLEANVGPVLTFADQTGLLGHSSLVPAPAYSTFKKYSERLSNLNLGEHQDSRYQIFLRLIAAISGTEEQATKKLLTFGLSKKNAREVIADSEAAKCGNPTAELTLCALGARVVLAPEDASAATELSKQVIAR